METRVFGATDWNPPWLDEISALRSLPSAIGDPNTARG